MSNHLTIAAVTAAIRTAVQNALNVDVPGASVQVGRPGTDAREDGAPRVTVFLYQVLPNAALRNRTLPWRSADGRLTNCIETPLDLNYVFSFQGEETTFAPERMVGATMRALEQTPILSKSALQNVADDDVPELAGSNIWRAAEKVRLTPLNLSLEELSKLWSVFFQVPYELSVAYQCSVVVLDQGDRVPTALPVTKPSISVRVLGPLRIDRIEVADAPARAVTWGDTIRIKGHGLGAPSLALHLGGLDVVMQEASATDNEILLPLTPAAFGGRELTAGIHALQAALPSPPDQPAHLRRTSGAVPLVLQSRLTVSPDAVTIEEGGPDGQLFGGTIEIAFVPGIAEGQSVRLLLDAVQPEPSETLVLDPTPPAAEPAFPVATMMFSFAEVPQAMYLVRAQVDGVDSAPDIDTDPDSETRGEITGPKVEIP